MNERIDRLVAYPFERLARLKAGITPPSNLAHIAMSIGEPKHAPAAVAVEALRKHLDELGSYPATAGMPELRESCGRWLTRRFQLPATSIDSARMILPVNGTREALFSFVQAVVSTRAHAPVVAMPNPFYQIYEGAALLAGAEPYFINTLAANRFVPDLDAVPAEIWRRCEVLFLCTPGNPSGAVLSLEYLRHALELAAKYDFVIASDECYAELYRDERAPPPSLLQACITMGNDRYERAVVFHSLSKRSSVPGLRSGFVAGDARIMQRYLQYRTYHGCAMPVPTQHASIAAWNDDEHVVANRALYREKFARVIPILAPVMDVGNPDAGFYLWPDVRGDDEAFARDLFAAQNVTLLPGSYLARETAAGNPGKNRLRISLVASFDECILAAERIRAFATR
jgi:N-succinyldiaminopimelate aminotransferase